MSDEASVEVLVLDIDLHLPAAAHLKAKRSIVQSIVRTLDGWKGVGAAEVGFGDKWQRTRIGVSIVGGSVSHLNDVAAAVERHVWSVPDVDVLSIEQQWFERGGPGQASVGHGSFDENTNDVKPDRSEGQR